MSSKIGTFHRHGSLFSQYLPYLSFFAAFLFIAATLIAALSFPAVALREDFLALSQQKNLAVCGCSIRTNTLTVKNTGDVTSVYELSQSGTAALWSSLAETRFTLKPGEVKDVRQFVRPPCSAEGAYQNTVSITTLFQTTKKIEQGFTVPLCNNIVAVPVKNTAISCPAQPMQFSFMLANPLSYPDVYDISVSPSAISLTNANEALAEQSVSISERSILLGPQQKKKVLIFLQMPSPVYGEASFDVIIRTRNSGLEMSIPINARINQCYGFQLSIPSMIKFCTEFENRLPLELANTALIGNEYQFTAGIMTPDGSSQEEYDLGTYTLPGKTKQHIEADLLVETEPGDYLLGVDAMPALGDIAQYVESPLEITYCDDNGKPLTVEEYEALQAALEPEEPAEVPEEPAEEPEPSADAEPSEEDAETESAEPEENPVSSAFIAFAILLVFTVLVLGVIAAKKRKKIFLPPIVPEYARLLRPKKKTKLLLGLLFVVLVILLVLGLAMKPLLFPAEGEGIEEANATEEIAEETEEQEPIEAAEEAEESEDDAEELNVSEEQEEAEEGTEEIQETPLIGVVLILLFIFVGLILAALAYRVRKKRATLATYELGTDKRAKKEEAPITLRASIIDIKEKAERILKPRKLLRWLGALAIIALLIAGGVLLATLLKTEHQNQVVSIDDSDDSFTERAAERGVLVSGNTIRVPFGTEITIPLVFRNIDDETTRTVNMEFGIDWLEPSGKKITLRPGQEKEADLTIKNTAPKGSYTVIFEVTNDKGELFAADELNIDIGGKKAWLIPTIVGVGIGLLAILLIIIVRKIRKKKPAIEIIGEEETRVQRKLREAAAKAAALEAVRLADIKAEKKAARKKKLKKWSVFAGALIFVALLTVGVFVLSRTYVAKLDFPTAAPVEISTEEPSEYQLAVTGLTNVPIKIINKNRNTTFNITAESSEDWITFDLRSVVVEPRDSETIMMLLAPHGGVKDGTYKLNLKIEEQSDREDKELFNSHILVKLSKRGFLSTLLAYWLYLLFGLLILASIIFLIGFEARKRHKAMLQELALEAKEQAHAPKPSKTKKSKYRLSQTRLKLRE